MCGIAGYISTQKLNSADMLRSLSHRGPDDSGEFTASFAGREIFLGHRRLSIIDLSKNGHQPMLSDDGNIALVFNGEIYNFEDLKKDFPAGTFRSKTDTEVILRLYEKKGIDFIGDLNGDFAIAIYNQRLGKLILIRDRAGVKPLYYYNDGTKFVFASEIKSIIASGVTAELAEENLPDYFVFKYVPGNRTLHKNIFRLDPAAYLEFDLHKNSFEIKKYWELKKNNTYKNLSYADAGKILFDLVKDSVEIRLISDVPVGNFLSGGLDSSAIAYFLKGRKDILHYCAVKSEKDLKKEGTTSDFYFAGKLSKEWGLNLQQAFIGSGEANTDLISRTLFFSDDLIADGSQIPSYLITQNAAKQSRVILSGMGADELFLGYAGHLLTMLNKEWLEKMPAFFVKPALKSFSRLNQGKGSFLAYRRYLHKMGKYYDSPGKYGFYNLVGDFNNSASVYKGNYEKTEQFISQYFTGEDVYGSVFHFEMDNFLVKNLHYTDRMAMANSVECRVPFLDHRIIEFAYSIPRKYKLSNTGTSKKIMKDAFNPYLPQYILNRRKAGFGMPLRSIFSSQETINKLLDREFFSSFGNFSMENIETVIKNHLSGAEDNSSIIYALVSFRQWHKLNFKS